MDHSSICSLFPFLHLSPLDSPLGTAFPDALSPVGDRLESAINPVTHGISNLFQEISRGINQGFSPDGHSLFQKFRPKFGPTVHSLWDQVGHGTEQL
ncbi:MAG: hypothetical protein F6K09_03815, partial [Merismopedia sp. SIO2A8]|nr:hypothetical protein [Merismopedia sp. SIO2A8]